MAAVEKFGQYLLRNQVISQEQLNEALQCQVIFGGRLGTNLVELGYITLDDLARLLSRRSGYPAASPEELEDLPREVLNSLPKATVEKFKIIPIRTEAKTLHLAVCDPTDVKAMDEIQFATGMRIKPYLLPELRMFYLLERHFGIRRDIRYIRLGRSLSRGKYSGAMVGTPATASEAPALSNADPGRGNGSTMPGSSTAELELKGFRKLKEGEELTDDSADQLEFSSASLAEQANSPTAKQRAGISADLPLTGLTVGEGVPAALPLVRGTHAVVPPEPLVPSVVPSIPAVAPPLPQPPVTRPAVRVESAPVPPLPLLDETHLEPIEPIEEEKPVTEPVPFPPPISPAETSALTATLRAAHDRDGAAAAALRLARTQSASVALFIVNKGMLSGWKGAGGALDRQGIESVMLPASADSILKAPAAGSVFQGLVPRGGLNDRLISALGRSQPVHALVIPIVLKTRVVNLLYADTGHQPIAPEAAAYLQGIARDMSAAYERIILARKKAETA